MKQVLAGAFLCLLPALLLAQSLAEVAKEERARRRSNDAPVRAFTEQDIGSTPEEPAAPTSTDTDGRALVSPAPPNIASTKTAPLFSLEDRGGRRVSLSDFRGQAVLVDFWATWCAPCRSSMPQVERLHQRYGERGLQVIGINIEGPSHDVLGYIEEGGYSFLFLFDEGNWRSDVLQSYGVQSIPRSFLIDRQGQILYSGHPDSLSEALVEAILP